MAELDSLNADKYVEMINEAYREHQEAISHAE